MAKIIPCWACLIEVLLVYVLGLVTDCILNEAPWVCPGDHFTSAEADSCSIWSRFFPKEASLAQTCVRAAALCLWLSPVWYTCLRAPWHNNHSPLEAIGRWVVPSRFIGESDSDFDTPTNHWHGLDVLGRRVRWTLVDYAPWLFGFRGYFDLTGSYTIIRLHGPRSLPSVRIRNRRRRLYRQKLAGTSSI